MINLHLGDCMDAMRKMRDRQYDLAIVDPPYAHDTGNGFTSRIKKHGSVCFNDFRPTPEYFDELRRVSTHQIIWGGNYFISDLGDTKCMLVWDKKQPVPTYARVELAWTSFQDKHAGYIDLPYFGSHGSDAVRVHPNQKPVALYKRLLHTYALPGWSILDTHLGSGSIAIACHDMGYSLDAWERDLVYLDKAYCRYQTHIKQLQLFQP